MASSNRPAQSELPGAGPSDVGGELRVGDPRQEPLGLVQIRRWIAASDRRDDRSIHEELQVERSRDIIRQPVGQEGLGPVPVPDPEGADHGVPDHLEAVRERTLPGRDLETLPGHRQPGDRVVELLVERQLGPGVSVHVDEPGRHRELMRPAAQG